MQTLHLLALEGIGVPQGMNTSQPEGLVDIDVAQARYHILLQEQGFDTPAALLQRLPQHLNGKTI